MYIEREVFETINVSTWDELKQTLNSFNRNWVFRGQPNAEWPLSNTLGRLSASPTIPNKRFIEKQMLFHFEKNASEYGISSTIVSDKLATLSVLQHYGAPTRLLDFTYSPYVSAFFASRDTSNSNGNAAIYAVDRKATLLKMGLMPNHLLALNIEDPNDNAIFNSLSTKTHVNLSESNIFTDLTFNLRTSIPFIAYVDSMQSHSRSNAQQGCFITVGNPDETFYQNIQSQSRILGDNNWKKAFKKIEFPLSLKEEIIIDLMKMNITEASLFPGLDGFARSLYYKTIMDAVSTRDFFSD